MTTTSDTRSSDNNSCAQRILATMLHFVGVDHDFSTPCTYPISRLYPQTIWIPQMRPLPEHNLEKSKDRGEAQNYRRRYVKNNRTIQGQISWIQNLFLVDLLHRACVGSSDRKLPGGVAI